MVDLIKPSQLEAATSVDQPDVLVIDNGVVVQKATTKQVVDAGNPVATEIEAIAGVDNSARMTPLRVRQVLNDTTAPSVERAQAWAESPTPPEPTNPDSKSAKTWAGIAEAGAEAANKAPQTWGDFQSAPFIEMMDGAVTQFNGVQFVRSRGADIAGLGAGQGWKPVRPASPNHFGADPSGTEDATSQLKFWLEYGGDLTGRGTYTVFGSGPDSGGVLAEVSRPISFQAGQSCVFKAGTDLDNDIIRIVPHPSVALPFDIEWLGGCVDQSLQKNSTSVPFSAEYPPVNPGTSGTCDGIYIICSLGNDEDGYWSPIKSVKVRGVKSYAGDHWQIAGGDSAVFIAGAEVMEVAFCEFTGARDLGFYGSGHPNGENINGFASAHNNVFHACCMGAVIKRQYKHISLHDNHGINTAEVVGVQGLTGVGNYVQILDNTGENAWHVARADSYNNLTMRGNKSYKHGHLLADGSKPMFVFNSHNATVRCNGASSSLIEDNELVSVDPLYVGTTPLSVVQLNAQAGGTPISEKNIVRGNIAWAGSHSVYEVAGQANENVCYSNVGAVNITGAASVDRDNNSVASFTIVNGVSSNATQTLMTVPVPHYWLKARLDAVNVVCFGSFTGTAGNKSLSLRIGTGVLLSWSDLPMSGDWTIEVNVVSNSDTSVDVVGVMTCGDVTKTASVRGVPASSRPFNASVEARTFSASDSVLQRTMTLQSSKIQ